MSMNSKEFYLEKLKLEKHIEGGNFNQMYISEDVIKRGEETKNSISSIYFLLEKGDVSKLHQLTSDEIWYFHDGDPLELVYFDENLVKHTVHLGFDLTKNQYLQYTIKKGWIFGSKTTNEFSLVSCAVAPAFTYEDFKLFTYEELIEYGLKKEDIDLEFCLKK